MSASSTAERYRVTNLRLEELELHNDHIFLLLGQSPLENLVHHVPLRTGMLLPMTQHSATLLLHPSQKVSTPEEPARLSVGDTARSWFPSAA